MRFYARNHIFTHSDGGVVLQVEKILVVIVGSCQLKTFSPQDGSLLVIPVGIEILHLSRHLLQTSRYDVGKLLLGHFVDLNAVSITCFQPKVKGANRPLVFGYPNSSITSGAYFSAYIQMSDHS